jgi:hypothetical protein
MEVSSRWLFVRIGTLILIVCYSALGPEPQHPDFLHPAPLKFLLVLFGVAVVGTTAVVSFMAKRRDENLWRPSWFVSPFAFGQPYNCYDFASLCILVYGMGFGAAQLIADVPNWFWEIPLTIGIAVWLSVRAAMLGNPDAIAPGKVPNQSTDPTP